MTSTAKRIKTETYIEMTVNNNRQTKTKRVLNWKNIGWVVSWGLLIFFAIPSFAIATIHMWHTGIPFHEWHPIWFGMSMFTTVWTYWRNPISILDYIDRWKSNHK